MGVQILGTSADSIDAAEDRERFDELLEQLRHSASPGHHRHDHGGGARSGQPDLGYPVLLRPSYVLGGQNMIIAYDDDDVKEYMAIITSHKHREPGPHRQIPDGHGGGGGRHLRRGGLS